MPKQRHRAILEKTLLALAAVFLLVGMMALGFLQTLSKENRALILIIASVGLFTCFAGLMSTRAIWKILRKWTWRRALPAWVKSSRANTPPKYGRACQLSDDGLKRLAIQVYARMGYLVVYNDGAEGIIRLVNPEGEIELVACTHQPNPAEIRSVHRLFLEMKRADAVRGFLWSPTGFTIEAIHWVRQKPIILADEHEIGRLVDCAYEEGSSLLEVGKEETVLEEACMK